MLGYRLLDVANGRVFKPLDVKYLPVGILRSRGLRCIVKMYLKLRSMNDPFSNFSLSGLLHAIYLKFTLQRLKQKCDFPFLLGFVSKYYLNYKNSFDFYQCYTNSAINQHNNSERYFPCF